MVKVKSYSLNLGYPVYGAQFVNDNTVIVAGGGGDGNNGIPNKMTAILIQPENLKKPIKRYRELTLNENEDSVMSLGVGNGTILAGINENPLMMAKGVNKHLRKFKFENNHLKFLESCQIHPNTNSTIYQKITAISNDGSIGVIVMSDTPSSIYIIETSHDLEEKFKIVTDGDVKDVTISLDGKLMCYITSSVFEVISLVTGRSVYKTNIDFLMSKIRFLDNNEVIISGAKNKDTVIAKFSIASSKIVQQKIVYKNLKGITSMDVNIKNNLTVLATSNYSLIILRTSDLKVIKVLNKVHDFAITKVVFSKSGKYLASCSAANTVNVIEIPENFAASKSILTTIFHYIFSIILIALLSVGVQYLYENGYMHVAWYKALEIYEHYKPQDSSGYFTVESISSFHTSSTATSKVTPLSTSSSSLFTSSAYSSTATSSLSSSISSPSYSSLSILELSFIDETSLRSETLSSVLELTSSAVKDDFELQDSTTTSSTYSTHAASQTAEVTVPPDEPTPTFDPADATLNGDIISYYEVTTALDQLPSTSSFLGEVDEVTGDILNSFTDTLTESVLGSSADSTIDSFVTSVEELTTADPESISELPVSSPSSTQIKEITREIIKEITSIVVSTQTQVSTTVHTSTALVTSVETTIATSVETEVKTSVVVETVTKEIIVTLPKVTDPATVSEAPPSFTEEFEKTGKSSTMTDENSELVELSTITETSTRFEIVETLQSNDFILEASGSISKPSTEEFKVQIEPSKEIYHDPAEAIRSQEEQVKQALETVITTNVPDSAITSISELYSIQIEPSSMIFESPSQAIEEEHKLIASEIDAMEPISDAASSAESSVSPSTIETESAHEKIVFSEKVTSIAISTPESESINEIQAFTSNEITELSPTEVSSVLASSDPITKDEL